MSDRLRARIQFDWLSAACALVPGSERIPLGRRIMGPNPVHWHLADTIVNPGWQTRPGDRESGFLPADYRSGVVVYMSQAAVDATVRTLESSLRGTAYPAVAFRAGRAVLATMIPPRHGVDIPEIPDMPDRVAAIMGVGQDEISVAAGAWQPDTRAFMGSVAGFESSDTTPLVVLQNVHPTVPRV